MAGIEKRGNDGVGAMGMGSVVEKSKFLSLVLRHAPQTIGLALDSAGWAQVDDLLERANAHGVALDRASLSQIVAGSDKQRFAFSDDGNAFAPTKATPFTYTLSCRPSSLQHACFMALHPGSWSPFAALACSRWSGSMCTCRPTRRRQKP